MATYTGEGSWAGPGAPSGQQKGRLTYLITHGDVTSGTTSLTVRLRIYFETTWGVSDSSHDFDVTGNWPNTSGNIPRHSGDIDIPGGGGTLLIYDDTFTITPSYSTTYNRSFSASLTGINSISGTFATSKAIVIPRRPYGIPGTPTGMNVSNVSTGVARLNWNSPADWGGSGENRYRWEYEQVGGGKGSGTTANRYVDITPAVPGGSYRFRVQAYNDNLGNGGGDSSWSAWTSWTNPPNAPSNPQSLVLSNIVSTGFRAAWSAPSSWGGQTGSFEYQLRLTNDTIVQSGAPASSPIDFSGLTAGGTYKFRVRAYNDGGQSGWVETTVNLPAGPQDAPVLSLVNAGPIGAKLDWTDIANWGAETGTYTFKYGTDPAWAGAQTTVVVGLGPTPSEYTIPVTLQPNSTYYAQVEGVNSYGAGPDSNTVQWNTSAPPVYVKVAGSWRSCSAVYVKVAGSWRSVVRSWVKVAGVWR